MSDGQPTRLYVKGVHLGFKRGLRTQMNHTSLIKIQGLDSKDDVDFYLGKRIAYITKGNTKKNGTSFRVTWGKVMKAHGSNGVVKAKFQTPLPPKSIGAPCEGYALPQPSISQVKK